MIYVDSCIPMYLVGADHPNKRRVLELVPKLVIAREEFITSAECFQEIIHRYRSLNDSKHLNAAYEALEEIVSRVEPIHKENTDQARDFAARYATLSSRDCLHLAVMRWINCDHIWTYDSRFDDVPSIIRLH